MSSSSHRIPGLDLLRAIAITWVMVGHLFEIAPELHGLPEFVRTLMSAGPAGVDLFFVLSGFLIGRILRRMLASGGGLDVLGFWSRRWLRTLPAYYAVLLGGLVTEVLGRSRGGWNGALPAYFVFLQTYLSDMPRFNWTWSLCIEEHFYLVLPLVLVAAARMRPGVSPQRLLLSVGVACLVTSLCARFAHWWLAGMPPLEVLREMALHTRSFYVFSHCRLDGIAMGLVVAALPAPTAAAKRLGPWAVAAAMSLVLAMPFLVTGPVHWLLSFTGLALGCAVLVWSASPGGLLSRVSVPGAGFISDISYAFYLTHLTVFGIARRALPGTSGALVAAIAIPAAIVVSVAIRRMVELPVIRLRERWFPNPEPSSRRSPPGSGAPRLFPSAYGNTTNPEENTGRGCTAVSKSG
ncbi:acyltransferase [Archangium sp.]|uniref:acyltransferase family protein n=1 Tax=Archangium sp. TaxID=1872627 RepID=UPI002D724591|nr:acyltransferase [Archangium sp.]HYO52661.1 acyltransferase [Archangium sp.]